MKTLPSNEETRKELFALLGTQGGTCHQLPRLIRVVEGGSPHGLILITPTTYVVFGDGGAPRAYRKYSHVINGTFHNQLGQPRQYVNWNEEVVVSSTLTKWLRAYVDFDPKAGTINDLPRLV